MSFAVKCEPVCVKTEEVSSRSPSPIANNPIDYSYYSCVYDSPRSPSPIANNSLNYSYYSNEYISPGCYSPQPGPSVRISSPPLQPIIFSDSDSVRFANPLCGISLQSTVRECDPVLTSIHSDFDDNSEIDVVGVDPEEIIDIVSSSFDFKMEEDVVETEEEGEQENVAEEHVEEVVAENFNEGLPILVIGRVEPVNAPEGEEMVVDNFIPAPEFENHVSSDSAYASDSEFEGRNDPDYIPEDNNSDSDSEDSISQEFDPEVDLAYESRLLRLYKFKKLYWCSLKKLYHLRRRHDLQAVERKLKVMKDRRLAYYRSLPLAVRRRNRAEQPEDKPKRRVDICSGCARPFYCQKIRRWIRCEECGEWLCPDCSANPLHCQDQ